MKKAILFFLLSTFFFHGAAFGLSFNPFDSNEMNYDISYGKERNANATKIVHKKEIQKPMTRYGFLSKAFIYGDFENKSLESLSRLFRRDGVKIKTLLSHDSGVLVVDDSVFKEDFQFLEKKKRKQILQVISYDEWLFNVLEKDVRCKLMEKYEQDKISFTFRRRITDNDSDIFIPGYGFLPKKAKVKIVHGGPDSAWIHNKVDRLGFVLFHNVQDADFVIIGNSIKDNFCPNKFPDIDEMYLKMGKFPIRLFHWSTGDELGLKLQKKDGYNE